MVFLLPMLPNLLFLVLQNPNDGSAASSDHLLLDIIEHGSQAIYAALLIFVVSRKGTPTLSGLILCTIFFLLTYYALWIAYFTVGASFTMLMLMAIVPVIYFLMAEIWLHNLPAVVFTAIFGVTHIAITYLDYH
ncbi:hypothetical protein CVS29_17330 [Arthrobacter psychrochitiniphilus]|uniref:Uncharacterized protein n=1 Tax=Arthrobacter psychrochitiniphilus TaxID=291045 RepID=A0A2V3DM61_9MICC|nr:hypothetical protein CVS29_17330 [Arthrobacter psychrochitiniphilus]